MMAEAIIFFIVVLLVIAPMIRKQREKALAERLKQIRKTTRNPAEAMAAVDSLIEANRRESDSIGRTKWFWFWS